MTYTNMFLNPIEMPLQLNFPFTRSQKESEVTIKPAKMNGRLYDGGNVSMERNRCYNKFNNFTFANFIRTCDHGNM